MREPLHGAHGAQKAAQWPKEADRKLLAKACEARASSVAFSDGREFTIKYSKATSIAWGSDYDVCFVSPISVGFVPCGWFHINFLIRGNNGGT